MIIYFKKTISLKDIAEENNIFHILQSLENATALPIDEEIDNEIDDYIKKEKYVILNCFIETFIHSAFDSFAENLYIFLNFYF